MTDNTEKLSPLCTEFTMRLASKTPTPGGGGAAALCGALSAALCSMAGELSLGKKSTAAHSAELEVLTAAAKKHSERLLALIDADAAAFEPLSRAYSIPKDAPGRVETLSAASLTACSAPLEILRECRAVSELLVRIYPICSRLMISDVGCAAALCRAAAECAAMNVYVNLPAITAGAGREKLKSETGGLSSACIKSAEAIALAVSDKLKEP